MHMWADNVQGSKPTICVTQTTPDEVPRRLENVLENEKQGVKKSTLVLFGSRDVSFDPTDALLLSLN